MKAFFKALPFKVSQPGQVAAIAAPLLLLPITDQTQPCADKHCPQLGKYLMSCFQIDVL